jgi:hypothetical protein
MDLNLQYMNIKANGVCKIAKKAFGIYVYSNGIHVPTLVWTFWEKNGPQLLAQKHPNKLHIGQPLFKLPAVLPFLRDGTSRRSSHSNSTFGVDLKFKQMEDLSVYIPSDLTLRITLPYLIWRFVISAVDTASCNRMNKQQAANDDVTLYHITQLMHRTAVPTLDHLDLMTGSSST